MPKDANNMRGRERNGQSRKKRLKTKGWSDERRAAQRERCLANKPWEHNTGPRTDQGKAISAQNALRHGLHSADYLALSDALLRQHAYLLDVIQKARSQTPLASTHMAHSPQSSRCPLIDDGHSPSQNELHV